MDECKPLVSGLFPAFLFLPNFVREEWEAGRTLVHLSA